MDNDLQLQENDDGTVLVVDPSEQQPVEQHEQHEQHGESQPRADGDAATAEEAAADAEAVATATSDLERAAIRERRRQERADKKAAQREREDNLRRELQIRDQQISEMSQQLVQINQRNASADLAQLDNTIKRASDAVAYYKGIVQEATTKQDGAAVAEATERMIMARSEAERLTQIKRNVINQAQAQPQGLNPRVKALADSWMSQNKWYDPSGVDEDSYLTLSIDGRLIQEGFNPQTEAYWNELTRRVEKFLPHRTPRDGSGHNDPTPPRGKPVLRTTVAGSGRESRAQGSGSSNGGTFQLSAARVQALKDAGTWDDPKARADAIRRYRDYDRSRAASADT